MRSEKPAGVGLRSFKTLAPYVKPHLWKIVGGTIFLILIDIAQIIMPRLIGASLDSILIEGKGLSFILIMVGGILGLGALIALGRHFWRRWLSGTGIRVITDLRNDLVNHLQKLSFAFHDKQQVGDLMAHATNDIQQVQQAITIGFVIAVDIIFMGIFNIIAMMTLHAPVTVYLTLYTMIPLAVLVVIVVQFGRLVRSRWKAEREAFSSMTARVAENLAGIRVVKAYVQEEGETEVFRGVSKNYVRKVIDVVKLLGLFFPLIMLLSNVALFLVFLIGGRYVIVADMSVGNFVAFQVYLGMLIWPIISIVWLMNRVQSGAASMGRINKLLETEPEITDDEDTLPLTEIEGRFEFKNLTFAYEGVEHPALNKINLEIHPGKITGIIGTLGSGKSTLISLIQRLYEAPQGTITVDGHDIRRIPIKVLRGAIGMVPQDSFLFSKTVAENIAFGLQREYSQEEVEKATKIAGIHEEILEFPQGYDTILGERGVTVSGGQKQRLTIARAILADPRILILDDSLSAVDADKEIEILTALKEIMRERAVIIISARPRSLAFADEILVMDEGHITERGTHEELVKKDGLYALFVKLQGVK